MQTRGRRGLDEGMRSLDRQALREALLDARQYTKALVDDLSDAQWDVPILPTINPVAWEIGHVGWFMERWCLRERGLQPGPSRVADADRMYDSSAIAHADRWRLPLPPRPATLRYVDEVLAATLEALEDAGESDRGLYGFRLALYHEDMHAESFAQLRQELGYPAPARLGSSSDRAPAGGDARLDGGEFEMGAQQGASGFVFDNEKWAHPVRVSPFAIARRPVLEGEFLAFVEDGGYRRDALWSAEGRAWRDAGGAAQPLYWRRANRSWERRVFDRWEPLRPDAPMQHVNAHEAEAYCRWAGRRLPSEAEWEFAALAGSIEWGGSVWEWTSTSFAPYPGFSADPYRDYSEPWFHTHRSVRGGSALTTARLAHPRFRNFYLPHRNDIFAGFRTAAY